MQSCKTKAPLRLAYLMSLRNSTADMAGQFIQYRSALRYMMSPLEFTVELLNTSLKDVYQLSTIIFDDDPSNPNDVRAVGPYAFEPRENAPWIFPPALRLSDGTRVLDLMRNIPSTYRALPPGDARRPAGKRLFEREIRELLLTVDADVVLVDGLLLILSDLIAPDSPYHRRVVNIHPGITREDSPFQRRGLYATRDAMWGIRGKQFADSRRTEMIDVPPVMMTGASLHFVDEGIDSGEVIHDVLNTALLPTDSIYELRWNNFQQSLFPALAEGLPIVADKVGRRPRRAMMEECP